MGDVDVPSTECPICLERMKDPVISKTCGHSACDICFTQLIDKSKCPICRTGPVDTIPNYGLRNAIAEIARLEMKIVTVAPVTNPLRGGGADKLRLCYNMFEKFMKFLFYDTSIGQIGIVVYICLSKSNIHTWIFDLLYGLCILFKYAFTIFITIFKDASILLWQIFKGIAGTTIYVLCHLTVDIFSFIRVLISISIGILLILYLL